MRILRRLVDRYFVFCAWWASRYDAIARLEAEITRERRRHRDEVDELRGQILMRDKQLEAMAEAHQRLRSIMQADIALNNRVIADATEARTN